jgi:hypothetical protein
LSMNSSLIQRSASKMYFQRRSTEVHMERHMVDRPANLHNLNGTNNSD